MAMDIKLSKESIRELIYWVNDVQNIRLEFDKLGFKIPRLEKEFVESLRKRDRDEKSLDYYFNEVIIESFFLPMGQWNAATRNNLRDEERSSYIDFLQNKIQLGRLNNNAQLHAILDPNLLLYTQLGIKNQQIWISHLERIKDQKLCETEYLNARILQLSPKAKTITASNVLKFISSIAEELGLVCALVENGSAPKILLSVEISDSLTMYVEWTDLLVLRKWGQLQISYFIQPTGQPLFAANGKFSPQYVLDFMNILFGANWYAWKNDSWNSVAIGLLAHAELLKICASKRIASVACVPP